MEDLNSTRKVFRARKTINAGCKSSLVTLGKIKNFLEGEKAAKKTLRQDVCLNLSETKSMVVCIPPSKDNHAKYPNGHVELEINLLKKTQNACESTATVQEINVESQHPYTFCLEKCKVDVLFEKSVEKQKCSPDEQVCAEKEFCDEIINTTRSEGKRKTPDLGSEEKANAKRLRASECNKGDCMNLVNKTILEQIQEIVKQQVLLLYKESFSNKLEELTARITQTECTKKHETLVSKFQNRVTKIMKRVNIALEAQKKMLISSSSNTMGKSGMEKDLRTKRDGKPSFIDLTEDDEQQSCAQESQRGNQPVQISEGTKESSPSSQMEQQQTLEGSEQTASSALLPKTPPPPELSVAADEISSYRLKQPASLPKTPSPPHLSPAKEHAFTFKNSVPQMTLPLNSSLMQQNVSSESCLPFGKPSQPASLLRTSPVANLTSRLDSTLLPQKFSPPATVPRTMLPPKVCATESCLNLSKADLQVSSLENLPSPQLCSEEQTAVKKGAYSGQFPLTPTPKIAEGEDSGSHNVAHPASLPKTPPPPPELPPEAATALPPQKPELKLTHVLNPKGIALSWYVVNVDPNCAPVHSYHLYAYHEESNIKTSQWKKLGEIKALPLPMACTLSQFVSGSRYHFAVRAKDIYGRYGPFCDIKSTSL